MSIPVLTVLVACTSTDRAEVDVVSRTHVETIAALIPDLPEPPSMPMLDWSYEDGLYCLDEVDADSLLDYAENDLARFRFEQERAEKVLEAVKGALMSGGMSDSMPLEAEDPDGA